MELAEEALERRERDTTLPDIDREESLSVSPDTKIYSTLLVIGYLQPVPSYIVDDVLEYENTDSIISNASYRDLVDSVGTDGTSHYYSLTPHGWKQIVGVHGTEDWRTKAEELLQSYTPSDSENEGQKTGLEAFGYDTEDS